MKLPEAVAAQPSRSRGRLHPQPDSGPRGPRDIFQRDRDRIIHSVAFRRLRHKTQVFIAPFGHAGEAALDRALSDAGGFDHNAHAIRIVTKLETPYPDFDGLNLSWEALEGLAKHNGPVPKPNWAMAEANSEWDLELS